MNVSQTTMPVNARTCNGRLQGDGSAVTTGWSWDGEQTREAEGKSGAKHGYAV